MASKRYKVVCTDRKRHGRIDFPDLIMREDGSISESATRTGSAALPPGSRLITQDGEEVPGLLPHRAVLRAEGHRAPHGTWRWECPSCGRDVPVKEANLRRWMEDTNSTVLDISLIP